MRLRRASHGPLRARGTCRPVSLAARGRWRFERPVFGSDTPVFGGGRPMGHGTGTGELDVAGRCALDELRAGGLNLMAELRNGYVALTGAVRVDGRVGHLLSFTFTEEVSHELV